MRFRSHKAPLVVLTLTLDIEKQPRLNRQFKVYLFMAQHDQQPGPCIVSELVVENKCEPNTLYECVCVCVRVTG